MRLWITGALIAFLVAAQFLDDARAQNSAPAKVQIFVVEWCPHCRELEGFLKKNHVQYTRFDIERDVEGRMKYKQLGGGGVPLVLIGSQVFRGFDETEITSALGLSGGSAFGTSL